MEGHSSLVSGSVETACKVLPTSIWLEAWIYLNSDGWTGLRTGNRNHSLTRAAPVTVGYPRHSCSIMSGEKKSWPKLRFPFRRTVPHETPRNHSDTPGDTGSKVSNTTRGPVIVPVFEVEPRKTSEHTPHTESVRSFSTWMSHPQNPSASHGDSYESSWSAQTGCTTPGANFGSFSGHAVLLGAYPRTCSPRISGDLEGRLGSAYRQIQNMPPSPISPTIRQMTGDPRTQFGVPQHSVINQPTLKMPSLPNPHTTHARSHSQPLPSSFPSESLPASWTWHEPSSAPRFRHPRVQAQSQKYHQPPSLQTDLNVHPDDHLPTTSLHSSQTSPAMILGPIKPYLAGAVMPLLPQPEDDHIRSELPFQRKAKLIKRRLAALSHVSSPSHITSEETGIAEGDHFSRSPLQKRSKLTKRCSAVVSYVSSSPPSSSHVASEETSTPLSANQESNSNKDVRNQNLLPLVRPPSPLRLDIVSPSTKCTLSTIDLLPFSRCISHGMIGEQTLSYHTCREATTVVHPLPCHHQALKKPVPVLKHLHLWLGLVHLQSALLSRHLLALRNTPNPALFRLTRRSIYP